MSGELQHCPACDEEYVAGVAACVECGGALQPGPLLRLERRAQHGRGAEPAPDGAGAAADYLLAELPGQQADHVVRVLLLENIACRVRCQDVEKQYLPGQPPAEPFAMTLPVAIFVAAAQREAAEDLLGSMEHEDVIGEQWDAEPELAEAAEPALADVDEEYEPLPISGNAVTADDAPKPESTTLRTIALIVAIGLVLLFLFAR